MFLPVVWWAGAITACAIKPDTNLLQILQVLTEKLDQPFSITYTPYTLRCVFTFTIAYVSGIGIYYSQKKNYRRGVEHGSAKWGDAASICKRYRDKRYTQNLILTQNFRMGLDCYKHKRNLNVLVVGGSGAGKPLLSDYRTLIVDEAHKLPEAARQMFGKNLCMDDIREIAYYLEREHQKEEAKILRTVMHDALHVVGAEHRIGKGIRETFRNTTNSVVSLWEGVEMLEFLLEKLERSVPKWIRNRLEEAKDVLECFCSSDGNYVRYLRFDTEQLPVLCAASREIPELLRKMLWDREEWISAILTSGTLKAGAGFLRTRQITGLEGRAGVQEYVAESPFSYERNCLLYLQRRWNIAGEGAGKRQ